MPPVGGALGKILLGQSQYDTWRVRNAIKRLAKQRYLRISENPDGSTTVHITKQGRIKALTYQLSTMQLGQPKKWDRRWRVVIFDIPNKYNRVRDIFRMRLKQLGLFPLQESVYVSPCPCFEEVEFLRELYGIRFTARYLLVERIEEDEALRDHFNLPS